MTIEEIKEWRKEGGSPHYRANEIIDTLLAEVEILNTIQESMRGHIVVIIAESVKRKDKLSIATEALERIVSANTQRITTARYIARTALERIKE